MKRVVVLGSINMDCVTTIDKHPLPGETVPGHSLNYFPGGKGANQAVAASRLGAETIMLGMVGNDGFADFMHQFLSNQNINTSQIKRANCATGTAFIAVDKAGENSIIVIGAANAEISAETFDHFIFTENDILVCQNEIPVSVMEHIFQKAKSANADIIYNPAPALSGTSDLIHWSDICIVNEAEYDFYKENLEGNNKTIIKTLGARGVEIFFDGRAERINGFQVNVLDTTGAGDCFTGALAARLSQGDNIINAAKYANKAAAISVQKKGASSSMPSVKEIYEIS